MPIDSSQFLVSLSPSPARAVVGMTNTISIIFSNISETDTGYNIGAKLTIPDGVSFVSSEVEPTSITSGPGSSIIAEWINLRDLLPGEEEYSLTVTLRSDTTFRETGLTVPFDIPLSSLEVRGYADTLSDGGSLPNIQIEKLVESSFIPQRYSLTASAPDKMPKGAGVIPGVSPKWPFTYELKIMNNSNLSSRVTLIDKLPRGVRYLGNLRITPAGYPPQLENPEIIGPPEADYVSLRWGFDSDLTLPPNSSYTISFEAAIWNNYPSEGVENTGERILHGEALVNFAELVGESGPVQVSATTRAMDIVINSSIEPCHFTDIGEEAEYELSYRVNQYDNVDSVIATAALGDGQSYVVGSSIPPPTIPKPPKNSDGTTTLTWNLGGLAAGVSGAIAFASEIDSAYFNGNHIMSGDYMYCNSSINGDNSVSPGEKTPDSSKIEVTIKKPSIKKEVTGFFYGDGTRKSQNIAGVGEFVEFLLTYDAAHLAAPQKNISVEDIAPQNMGLFPEDETSYEYGGSLGSFTGPTSVSPNGVRWELGEESGEGRLVPGGSTWTVRFKVPVNALPENTPIKSGNNLARLLGDTTEGLQYTARSQENIKFGEPNLKLEMGVQGPDINAARPGETYTFTIRASNPQKPDGTTIDALDLILNSQISEGLNLKGTPRVTGSGLYDPPDFSSYPNISWRIRKLSPDNSLTLTFSVTLASGIPGGKILTSTSILEKYEPRASLAEYTESPIEASAAMVAIGFLINKTINPPFARIGDLVTNIITVTVPLGVIATDIVLKDTFPVDLQSYQDNATVDSFPDFPTVGGGLVTFSSIDFVDASMEQVDIIYTFNTRVTGEPPGSHVPPYFHYQTDSAMVTGKIFDMPTEPVSSTANLQVRTPNLVATKDQRNQRTGEVNQTLNYIVGDTIEYKLIVQNNGTGDAYNIQVTDPLSPLLGFVGGSFNASAGTPSFIPGPSQAVNWSIPFIEAGKFAQLRFRVITLPGIAAGGSIQNSLTVQSYSTNDNGFGIIYPAVGSNSVTLVAPSPGFNKSAVTEGKIGDLVNYTLTIDLPNGTVMYNPTFVDTLPNTLVPVRQSFTAPPNSTWQEGSNPAVPITPSVGGQNVGLSWPQIPFILDASSSPKTFRFFFPARITNAPHGPSFSEQQSNSAVIKWSSSPTGAPLDLSLNRSINITASTPNIVIEKLQRKGAAGDYTKEPLTALPGDTIYYKLRVVSNGGCPAYNVIINDVLSTDLIFSGIAPGWITGTVTPPPPGPGGTLNWTIPRLDPGGIAELEFIETLASPLPASHIIRNRIINAQYDSNNPLTIVYTTFSNETLINIEALGLTKTTPRNDYQIGEEIDYTLTVTVPSNVSAYNLTLNDELSLRQNYVDASWSSTLAGTLTATQYSMNFVFTANPVVGPQTITMTFKARVIEGLTLSPYTQPQRNIANLSWNYSDHGTPAPVVSVFKDVTVKCPDLAVVKEQKRSTDPDTSYTTGNLTGLSVGDRIHYRLTITNIGEGTAYNIVTTDVLPNTLTYQETIPPGNPEVTPPVPGPGGTLTWIHNPPLGLLPLSSISLVFEVLITSGSFESSQNNGSSGFDSSRGPGKLELGPVISNTVGFLQVGPRINKAARNYSNPPVIPQSYVSALVGDIVEYSVTITVPLGNIVYDLQLRDTLPNKQGYDNYATLDGIPVTPSYSHPVLTFPFIDRIDASSAEQTRTYILRARVTAATEPFEGQTNAATVYWNKQQGSDPGTPITDVEVIFASTDDLAPHKEQKLLGDPEFKSGEIDIETGSTVVYKLTANNNKSITLYNIMVYDFLSPLHKYLGAPPPTRGVINHDGATEDGLVIWRIDRLSPGEEASAEFNTLILPGGASKGYLNNTCRMIYTTNVDPASPLFGPKDSNEVRGVFPGIALEKVAVPDSAAVGDIVTYKINVTIPKGITAYNVVVSDTIPQKQVYVGNAYIDDAQQFPSPSGQIVEFPPKDLTATGESDRLVVYRFDARILDGENDPELNPVIPPVPPIPPPDPVPYQESQLDSAKALWTDEEGSQSFGPIEGNKDVTVGRPVVWVSKEENNITKGSGYSTTTLPFEVGDIIEYRITANNFGSSKAYNVVITEPLNSLSEYYGEYSASGGSVSFNSSLNTLVWTIPEIGVRAFETLNIKIRVKQGLPLGSGGEDSIGFSYKSTNTYPVSYNGISNTVYSTYPIVMAVKTSNTLRVSRGSRVRFEIDITIPEGTGSYNLQLTDRLPPGFEYAGSPTLNEAPVTGVTLEGLDVKFPKLPFTGISPLERHLIYAFDTDVVAAPVPPGELTASLINTAIVNWEISPGVPAQGISYELLLTVTVNYIIIALRQRNATRGGDFTALPIEGGPGDIIEYEITVFNNGANEVFDITSLVDLVNELSYVDKVFVPSGDLTHSGELFGGTVNWTFPSLASGQSLSALYSTQIASDYTGKIEEQASASFANTSGGAERFGGIISNVVEVEVRRRTAKRGISLKMLLELENRKE